MSKSAILVNGENTSDVVEFTTDANINMVTVNDISCVKRLDNFSSKDSPKAILGFPCDFDHIYATSMNDNTKSKTVNSEISLLKELLLSHLDLIQQQSEQLVTKDKQIHTLQKENETLKLRLERMDRRVTLQKHRDTPDAQQPKDHPPNCSPITINAHVPSLTSASSPVLSPSIVEHSGTVVLDCNVNTNVTTISRKRRRDDSGSVCSKRTNRSASWSSVRDNKDESTVNNTGKLNGRSIKREGHRRRRKRQMKNGDLAVMKKDENILLTGMQYYTPVGDDITDDVIEPKVVNGCVLEVPSWRTKHFTSCYSMEGTENLSEDVFERRHARLEHDERRRKRWDVQRIREQRHMDRLRQRQRKDEEGDDESEELTTFWPHADDAQFIEVTEMLPVSAFGSPLTQFKPTNFSLPWLNTDKETLANRLRTVQPNKRKR